MQQGAGRTAQRGCRGDRLDRAGLVIGRHQADQRRRTLGEQAAERIEVSDAVAVHRKQQRPRRRGPHRIVLGRPDDQPPAAPERMDRQRIRLGAAGGEHEVGRAPAEPRGDRLPRLLQALPGGAAGGMHRGRIARRRRRREHRRARRRAQRLGRIGVKIRHCCITRVSCLCHDADPCETDEAHSTFPFRKNPCRTYSPARVAW
jgi:hypothetical protein